jgi:heme-degrading monooxygenase HmoA
MSVVVTIHVPVGDVAKAIEGLQNNAALLSEISGSVTDKGMLHHRFVAGDGELLVIDEWDSEAQFRAFFDGDQRVGQVMSDAGASGPPTVTIYQSIEAAGTV